MRYLRPGNKISRRAGHYHKETSVGLPALAGRGKELTSEGSMPDGVTIIDKLDEPSMGESSFKGRLPPLGGSPVTAAYLAQSAKRAYAFG